MPQYRDKQIEKFKKMGDNTFDVSAAFVGSLPPKVAALIIAEINEIFEAYPNIIRAFVDLNKKMGITFKIRLTYISETSYDDGTIAMNHLGDIAFNIDYFSSLEYLWWINKEGAKSGDKCPSDNIKLAQRNVAHEVGHLIERILRFCSVKGYKNYRTRGEENNKEVSTIMKEDILKIARSKFNYYGEHISDYGATSDDEWLAEVCAHAFCSANPNALGLAFREFLNQQETELSEKYAPIFNHGSYFDDVA